MGEIRGSLTFNPNRRHLLLGILAKIPPNVQSLVVVQRHDGLGLLGHDYRPVAALRHGSAEDIHRGPPSAPGLAAVANGGVGVAGDILHGDPVITAVVAGGDVIPAAEERGAGDYGGGAGVDVLLGTKVADVDLKGLAVDVDSLLAAAGELGLSRDEDVLGALVGDVLSDLDGVAVSVDHDCLVFRGGSGGNQAGGGKGRGEEAVLHFNGRWVGVQI